MAIPLHEKLPVARIRAELAKAEALSVVIAKERERLLPTMTDESLGKLLDQYGELVAALGVAGSWSDARYSVAQTNETESARESEIAAAATKIAERIVFFTLALKEWPPARLERAASALPKYRQFLREIALGIPHTLSEPEERALLIANEHGSGALEKIYDLLTGSFRYTLVVEGKTLVLNRGEILPYTSNAEHDVRKAAILALVPPFELHKDVLGELYRSVAGGYRAETTTLRHFTSPIDARHHGNMIPAAALDAIIRVSAKHRGLFQRYVQRKAQIIGLETFTRFDFMAPVSGIPRDIPYDEGIARVLRSFDAFAPWLGDAARTVIDSGHLDPFPANGKRSGACCYGIAPGETPIVLANYTGTWDDVSTLAHELGHAAHDIVAVDKPVLTFQPPLVLAETASTFAEFLLFLDALRDAPEQEAIALLCAKLDDLLLTIVNQLRITRFEQEAFVLLEAAAPLSELDELWARLMREDFPDIEFPETSGMWRSISHIYHSPFYCYSYVFGILLVCALVRRKDEPGFADRVKAILATGGDAMPAELLAQHGIDLTDDAVWEDGFATIQELVEELEVRLHKRDA